MKLTVLSPYLPYEGVPHAGGQFLLNWLRSLASRGAEVTLVVPQVHSGRAVHDSSYRVIEVENSASEFACRWGARLTRPVLHPGWGVGAAIRNDRDAARALAEADVVEIQWSQFLPLISQVRSRPVVGVVHDVISDSVRKRAKEASSRRDRLVAAAQWPAYRAAEPRLLNRCAAVLTFSDRDAELLRTQRVQSPISTIAPWVEPVSAPRGPSEAQTVLMVGAFGRSENSDSARWFIEECWPRVRSEVPRAKLVLAGDSPSVDLQGPGVVATGWIDSLDQAYRDARVVIAPMVYGAGLKFKVAQAMSHALPVVATSIGADGYTERGGKGSFAGVCDNSADFSAEVVKCLTDLMYAREIGERAAKWVGATFSWDAAVDGVIELYSGFRSGTR